MTKLTKRSVETLRIKAKDYFVWDNQIVGFGVRIMPSGAKTYQAQNRKGGRTRRVSLGRHGNITAEQARNLAREVMGQVAQGDTLPRSSASTAAPRQSQRFANGSLSSMLCKTANPLRRANITAR